MPATSLIRSWWGSACRAIGTVLLPAYRALDAWLVAYGYELRQADTGAFNCRQITGGDDYSLHAYGPGARFTFTGGVEVTTAVAVDLNWLTNPYGPVLKTDMPPEMIAAIKGVRTNNGVQVWRWGGDYAGNKDAMHFEIVARPADLATGIDLTTLPQSQPAPQPKEENDLVYRLAWLKKPDKPGVLYRVLFAKGKDDELVPVEAYDVPSEPKTVERWRGRLEEIPPEKPIPANTFIRIMDGPYKNVS